MDVVIDAVKDCAPMGSIVIPSQHDFTLNLLTLLGADTNYTPLADFCRLQKGLEAGRWFIISPIHWEATHNDAMIVDDGREFAWTEQLSRNWFTEVSHFLAQDRCELVYLSPYQWLMKCPEDSLYPHIKSLNLNHMLHQSIMPCLQALDSTMRWVRLHTELQMFLSSHPLNIGCDPTKTFNGIWIWGGGIFTPTDKKVIITDDNFIQSLFPHQAVREKGKSATENLLWVTHDCHSPILKEVEQLNQKNTINWYWNNQAYRMSCSPWYKRIPFLWRK